MKHRLISDIAYEIEADWAAKVTPTAREYLSAMKTLGDIHDRYVLDSAAGIVGGFLEHSRGWQGDVARKIKAELRAMMA